MWHNEDFNKAFAILNGDDPVARRKAVAQMLEISENQDPPGTYLYLLPLFYGKSDKIKWEPSGLDFMDFRAGNLEVVE